MASAASYSEEGVLDTRATSRLARNPSRRQDHTPGYLKTSRGCSSASEALRPRHRRSESVIPVVRPPEGLGLVQPDSELRHGATSKPNTATRRSRNSGRGPRTAALVGSGRGGGFRVMMITRALSLNSSRVATASQSRRS